MRGAAVLPGAGGCGDGGGVPPLHRLEVPMPNALPFAMGTFDTIGAMSRADFPHRHTFYEIVHITGGAGAHVLDLARFPLRPPHLCVIAPGQVHQWECAAGPEGWVILFTEDFLLDHPDDRALLHGLGPRPWLELDREAESWTSSLVGEMYEEYRTGAEGFHGVLRALLHVLLVRAARLPATAVAQDVARANGVAGRFTALVARADDLPSSVRACADRIGVSVGYLTEAVKEATGRTPGELIRQARTHEAKRLLLHTELTVRQVANRVGFTDPAYFCRFFRRETGASPGDFRRGGGDYHHDHRIASIARTRSSA
ncbi:MULTISPECIES: AraC family transcriptional regulator [unclassified Streptomyces]|uniref:AraC family transcriptional regulator n=1 Tax=unclassified Streptomyces TaxID=2593676 RepID=UPI0033FEA829